jgi:hypothetical protein
MEGECVSFDLNNTKPVITGEKKTDKVIATKNIIDTNKVIDTNKLITTNKVIGTAKSIENFQFPSLSHSSTPTN